MIDRRHEFKPPPCHIGRLPDVSGYVRGVHKHVCSAQQRRACTLTSITRKGGAGQVDNMGRSHNKQDGVVHEGGQIGQAALVGEALHWVHRPVSTHSTDAAKSKRVVNRIL